MLLTILLWPLQLQRLQASQQGLPVGMMFINMMFIKSWIWNCSSDFVQPIVK